METYLNRWITDGDVGYLAFQKNLETWKLENSDFFAIPSTTK